MEFLDNTHIISNTVENTSTYLSANIVNNPNYLLNMRDVHASTWRYENCQTWVYYLIIESKTPDGPSFSITLFSDQFSLYRILHISVFWTLDQSSQCTKPEFFHQRSKISR